MNRTLKWLVSGMGVILSSCADKPFQPALNQPLADYMPQGFSYVDRVIPSISTDLKYSGSDNFIGRPLNGYRGKRAILRREAVVHLAIAQKSLRRKGYGLLVYDAYRPHTAMIDIGKWGKDKTDQKMKAKYYPGIDKRRIFADNYIRDFSEHSRGVAVDITLIDLKSGKPVDMGGYHDLLDPSSATDSFLVTPAQRAKRQLLKEEMERAGFANYAPEWWHYRLSPEPDEMSHFYFPLWDGMKPEGQYSMKTDRVR